MGHFKTIMLGALLLIVASTIALFGHTTRIFLMTLICLGVGWNLMYIGGFSLLTETYHPNERSKAHATYDFIVFGCSCIASLLSGVASNMRDGWSLINQGSIVIALAFLIFLLVARLLVKSKIATGKRSYNQAGEKKVKRATFFLLIQPSDRLRLLALALGPHRPNHLP